MSLISSMKSHRQKEKFIAIGLRLKACHQVKTVGFKPNFTEYTKDEQQLIREAEKIYYPTAFYADLFNVMGKETFPSYHTYKFALDKIKQTAMFNLLDIPHPRTKVFYGKTQKSGITDLFSFPFVAKKARGSAKGNDVHLIQNKGDLNRYLLQGGPAYIQEYLPIDRDMRIIIIGSKIRLSYWRIAPKDSFKTNLSQGGTISFDPLPQKALDLARYTAEKCGWDDVGIDIIEHNNSHYILEGNMKYGTKGFKAAGIDYKALLAELIEKDEI
jgi:ribosomal protein S6--L-glutamate ligase